MSSFMEDIDNDFDEDFYAGYPVYDTWVQKDGTEIKIKDMQTSHIENCIKLLQRNMPDFPFMLTDTAQDCAEIEYEALLEKTNTWIEVFEDELKARFNPLQLIT